MNWLDALRDWADANNALIALFAFIISLVGGFFGLIRARSGHVSIREQIEDPASHPGLIADYRTGAADAYFAGIARVLAFAERTYGPKPLSWGTYARCLSLAFLYAVLFILLGWVLFNLHSPAGLTLFGDEPRWWVRAGAALALIVGSGVAGWILVRSARFASFVVDWVFPVYTGTARPGFHANAGRAVVEWFAGAFAVAFALAFAFAGAFSGAVAFHVAFAGAGAFAGAFAGAVAFHVAFAVAFATAGAFAVAFATAYAVAGAFAGAVAFAFAGDFLSDDPLPAAVLLLTFAFLPSLNALADMLSLAATRWFLARVVASGPEGRRASLSRILAQVLADFGVAALCLALLLATLVAIFTLWEGVWPATLPFRWQDYWADARADWRTGTALWLMVLTTLLPTFVHVVAGLGALWTHRSRLLDRVADRLAAQPADEAFSKRDVDRMVRQIRQATLWGYGRALAVAGLGLAVLAVLGVQLIAVVPEVAAQGG